MQSLLAAIHSRRLLSISFKVEAAPTVITSSVMAILFSSGTATGLIRFGYRSPLNFVSTPHSVFPVMTFESPFSRRILRKSLRLLGRYQIARGPLILRPPSGPRDFKAGGKIGSYILLTKSVLRLNIKCKNKIVFNTPESYRSPPFVRGEMSLLLRCEVDLL